MFSEVLFDTGLFFLLLFGFQAVCLFILGFGLLIRYVSFLLVLEEFEILIFMLCC